MLCIMLTSSLLSSCFFFFNDTATTEIYTLSLHDALPISDIGFVDWYVKNRNADRYPMTHLWTAVERLVIWGKGKPVGAFVECSNQRIAPEGREPTVGEMRAEIIGSIIHGARLIAYFPESPGKKDNKGKQ